MNWYQKGKTNLDFTEARDSEWHWHWHQLGRTQVCTSLKTDNHASTPPLTLVLRIQRGKGSPYSITERRVPELIPVLGSQPASDESHKPGGRLPLLYARHAVTPATLKRAATNFAAW